MEQNCTDVGSLDDLKDSIIHLGRENHEKRCFYPHEALFRLLDRPKIEAILHAFVSPPELREVADTVFYNGRLVFSILVSIGHVIYITKFIEGDQLQLGQLDSKLPMNLESLRPKMKETHAMQFFRGQWGFIAPIFEPFALRRDLHENIVFPILNDKKIGRGGFGDIYHIGVDPDHQRFEDSAQEVPLLILYLDVSLIIS